MNKHGEGLALNIVIIAVILLVVLVVVLLIFNKNFFRFSSELDSCSLRGGTCEPEDKCTAGAWIKGEFKECTSGPGCCIKFGTG